MPRRREREGSQISGGRVGKGGKKGKDANPGVLRSDVSKKKGHREGLVLDGSGEKERTEEREKTHKKDRGERGESQVGTGEGPIGSVIRRELHKTASVKKKSRTGGSGTPRTEEEGSKKSNRGRGVRKEVT